MWGRPTEARRPRWSSPPRRTSRRSNESAWSNSPTRADCVRRCSRYRSRRGSGAVPVSTPAPGRTRGGSRVCADAGVSGDGGLHRASGARTEGVPGRQWSPLWRTTGWEWSPLRPSGGSGLHSGEHRPMGECSNLSAPGAHSLRRCSPCAPVRTEGDGARTKSSVRTGPPEPVRTIRPEHDARPLEPPGFEPLDRGRDQCPWRRSQTTCRLITQQWRNRAAPVGNGQGGV